MRRLSLLQIIGLLLWLLALALAGRLLWQLPLDTLAASLTALDAVDWLGWIGINAVVIVLLTWRWQVLLRMLDAAVPLALLLQIRQAGQAATFLTPGPHVGGEPLQLYWLCQRGNLPLPTAILGLGFDRLYELVLNALVFGGSVMLLALSPALRMPDWQQGLTASLLLIAALMLLAVVSWRRPQWLSRHFARLAQRWRQHPRLSQFSRQWQTSWQQLRMQLQQALRHGKRRLLLAALLSALGWLAMLAELALLLQFLGLAPQLFDMVLLVVAMRAALLIPAPGGIGPVEAALLGAFQLLGLPLTAAGGLIVLTRLRDLVILLIGLGCAYHLGRRAAATT